jgi:hypothetical protein
MNEESRMTNGNRDTIEVMLNIYSGRPNPSWSLSGCQIDELRELLQASKERLEGKAKTPYLGYIGFVIFNRGRLPGIPYKVRVYRGVLTLTEKKEGEEGREVTETAYYADTQHIESWLLKQAIEHDYAESIEKMGGPRLHR